ncbi:hypothetical protein ABH920_009796 [Catenulispora sp. EB89]|uniref:hypothetical protein n=1 Tax=Catenulispora sp. EB89 TaxID=3156257 RepID=UPI0035183D0D
MGSSTKDLQEAAPRMVVHRWGHGDISEHGFPRERMSEYGLLYFDDELRCLRELDPTPPVAAAWPLCR